MDGIISSINEALKKRTTSATFGTYLFFWATYHWQGLYITFFVDQQLVFEKYGLLKNEYASSFFGYHGPVDWYFIWGLVLPAILTYMFIFIIPRKILVKFYKEEQGYKIDKRIIKLKEEERIAQRQEKLAVQVEKTVDAEIKASNKKQEAARKDPKILWDEEFRTIQNSSEFRDLLICIYQYNGNVLVEGPLGNLNNEFELDPNSLKLGDSRGLVNIVNAGKRIELTTKGKYFASKYQGRI